ncbi:YrrS family protein [Peribacillus kribbensis]|uniref:YrrS family protein n=1 Tax=Peribacillus kribbensis TaxID=356658 RepID=UPI00041F88CE|nr:YrrS family protein [Peribacillus kribbensis]
MDKDFKQTTRIDKTKQRKANRIYNILIVVVSVLIISVAAVIFLGKDEQASNNAPKKHAAQQTKEKKADTTSTKKKDNQKAEKDESEQNADNQADLSGQAPEAGAGEADASKDVEVPADDSNVKKAYKNDSWKPVGTTQQGEHVAKYDQGSQDWNEMEKALAYGAGINPDNITVWWIQNNGSPNSAVGTVSAKDNDQAYRVFIDWVDGQGWKPVKVELLKVNDKK